MKQNLSVSGCVLCAVFILGCLSVAHLIMSTADEKPSLIMYPVLLLAGALYILPAIAAILRRHGHPALLTVLNILLGWTLFGWIGCLAWAFVGGEKNGGGTETAGGI